MFYSGFKFKIDHLRPNVTFFNWPASTSLAFFGAMGRPERKHQISYIYTFVYDNTDDFRKCARVRVYMGDNMGV